MFTYKIRWLSKHNYQYIIIVVDAKVMSVVVDILNGLEYNTVLILNCFFNFIISISNKLCN